MAGLHFLVIEGVLILLNFDACGLETLKFCGNVTDQLFVDLIDGGLIDFNFAYRYTVYDLDTFEGLHVTKSSPS